MKFTVGQKLWWVRTRWSRIGNPADDGAEVTVTSVGRRWIGLDNKHRIDSKTLLADGGEYSQPGRCYLSRSEYRHQTVLNEEWQWLKRMFPADPPPGLTLDSIQLIASVLEIEPRKKTA